MASTQKSSWFSKLSFNWVDVVLMTVGILVVLGIALVQTGCHQTSGQKIDGETDIFYTVFLRNVKSLRPNALFKKGQKLSMTIRNQPRGKVEVVAMRQKPKQIILPKPDGNYAIIPDPDDAMGFDYWVKFKDNALITPDGYVTNGIKVKTGMHIVVEGYDFQLPGVIADVQRVVYVDGDKDAVVETPTKENNGKSQTKPNSKAPKASSGVANGQ